MNHTIILIGGGNMGGAIATRWKVGTRHAVHVVEADATRRTTLEKYGITCHATLAEAPAGDVVVLAIKPQQFAGFAGELTTALKGRTPVLVSIMAGVALTDLAKVTSRVVRVMPNLPALIGESMSVLCAPDLDAATQQSLSDLFTLIGAVAWVKDEAQLHAVTAISGSGPGYVFAFMEALEQAAIAQGLDASLAQQLIRQTLRGSAILASESADNAGTLRAQVTSKGGTTEAALKVLAEGQFSELVVKAAKAAADRSKALANG